MHKKTQPREGANIETNQMQQKARSRRPNYIRNLTEKTAKRATMW